MFRKLNEVGKIIVGTHRNVNEMSAKPWSTLTALKDGPKKKPTLVEWAFPGDERWCYAD